MLEQIAKLRENGLSQLVDALLTDEKCYDKRSRIDHGYITAAYPALAFKAMLEKAGNVLRGDKCVNYLVHC